MKSAIQIILISFLLLYGIVAFITWDVLIVAHTSEGGRFGLLVGTIIFTIFGAVIKANEN